MSILNNKYLHYGAGFALIALGLAEKLYPELNVTYDGFGGSANFISAGIVMIGTHAAGRSAGKADVGNVGNQ